MISAWLSLASVGFFLNSRRCSIFADPHRTEQHARASSFLFGQVLHNPHLILETHSPLLIITRPAVCVCLEDRNISGFEAFAGVASRPCSHRQV